MYKILRATLAIIALSATLPPTALAQTSASSDADAIAKQLQRYERTLNTADIDGVMELYAKDAVFMPQHSLPAVGRDAVRSAYRHVFDTIKLNIRFEIDEVHQLSNDWAFARTRSTGTVKVLASDQAPIPAANQELFVLHREGDDEWRFVRYIFSTTTPATQR
jgi:uncharacterized protein (TIGR02246 family)